MKKNSKPQTSKATVLTLFDIGVEEKQARLDQLPDGSVIYIDYIEPFTSETYGDGVRIRYRDLPNAATEYSAAIFSAHNVALLSNIAVRLDVKGELPRGQYLKVTVRKSGKSYRLE